MSLKIYKSFMMGMRSKNIEVVEFIKLKDYSAELSRIAKQEQDLIEEITNLDTYLHDNYPYSIKEIRKHMRKMLEIMRITIHQCPICKGHGRVFKLKE